MARAARYQLMLAERRLRELAQHGAMQRMREVIGRRQQQMDELTFRLRRAAEAAAERRRQRLEMAATRLRHFDLRRQLAAMRRELEARLGALAASVHSGVLRRETRWQRADARLRELSPAKILERGYSLVFDAAGKLVKDAAQVKAGDEISARLARGEIRATVK